MTRDLLRWGIKTKEDRVMDRDSWTEGAVTILKGMDPQDQIDTCMEWARVKFRALCFSLALAGFGKCRVIEGRRTFEEQCRLYGQGRSKDEMAVIGVSAGYADPTMSRVSWLLPAYSQHVKGLAIDFDFTDYEASELAVIEDVVRQLGITWGGVWSVRDYAHFEI